MALGRTTFTLLANSIVVSNEKSNNILLIVVVRAILTNVIKLLMCNHYGCNKLECFVTGRPFQPSLMIAGMARSLPWRNLWKVLHSDNLELYSQILDWAENSWWDKHSNLLRTFVKLMPKRFVIWGQGYKTFSSVIDEFSKWARVLVLGKLSSLI